MVEETQTQVSGLSCSFPLHWSPLPFTLHPKRPCHGKSLVIKLNFFKPHDVHLYLQLKTRNYLNLILCQKSWPFRKDLEHLGSHCTLSLPPLLNPTAKQPYWLVLSVSQTAGPCCRRAKLWFTVLSRYTSKARWLNGTGSLRFKIIKLQRTKEPHFLWTELFSINNIQYHSRNI